MHIIIKLSEFNIQEHIKQRTV